MRLFWFSLLMLGLVGPVQLQEQEQGEEKQKPKEEATSAKEKVEESSEEKYPEFDKVIKGLKEKKGLYTLYEGENKLLALIPEPLLKKPFLLATSFSKGRYSGWMWDDFLVQWEKIGKKGKFLIKIYHLPKSSGIRW